MLRQHNEIIYQSPNPDTTTSMHTSTPHPKPSSEESHIPRRLLPICRDAVPSPLSDRGGIKSIPAGKSDGVRDSVRKQQLRIKSYERWSMNKWLSASEAGKYIGVSSDTIWRRALRWQETPMTGRIRYKLLRLGDETRMERRYLLEDVEALLVS